MAVGVPARAAAQTQDGEAAPRPNILVIVADDMGWGQPGFNGGTEVLTPNMDRIADEGVKLTQFYVQPQCAMSRAALLTGRYSWKNGVGTNPHPETDAGMLLDERTIAQALRAVDYSTWIVGKWHLGNWLREHLPLQRGFDHHYGAYTGQIRSFTHDRAARDRLVLDWHRNGRPVIESGYSTFLLAEEAVQLIGRHDGASPFFLYLPFNAVHTPHQAPQEYKDLYSGSRSKQRAMLKAMDDAIGWVLAALERKGILDDTLVMFLNDNGDAPEAGTQSPYRGRKATYFEGGIRVPAVVRWPSEIPAGSETDALLHVVDLFPTFAGLAGASTADGQPLDGLDAWATIAHGAESPRTEVVHSPFVLRTGDWKLIEAIAHTNRWVAGTLQLYNIAEDPYETTNLAATETERVSEMAARLDHHGQFARYTSLGEQISDSPLVVFGEEENEAFGTAVQRALTERESGNTGPTLVRLEAVGDQVKLSFDEALDAGAVPPASAFTVVVNPGYNAADVEEVAVRGRAVLLTLKEAPASSDTVGLTYEVPDTGAIRDVDNLEAVGVTWVTGAVTGAFLSSDATLSALSLSGIEIGTFSAAVTAYRASVGHAVATTTVTATANHSGARVSIDPGSEVNLALGANAIAVTVTAEDGTTTKTYTVTVTRAGIPEVSIAAVSSLVREGAAAAFEVRLAEPAFEALTVAVSVTESGSMLSGAPPVSVAFSRGDTSATLSAPTAGDAVVEADSTVTAAVTAGTGYTVGTASSAAVTVEDDDAATFTVTATPSAIDEGESATLTVAISNGVTFAEDQTILLAASGTASASDYTGVPATLTLPARASSVTATLVAAADQAEEEAETVTVTASHGGSAIGSASVTINSVSQAATLATLSLSGVDIGTFSAAVTSYQASVANSVTATTVTATASHSEASVSIKPGSEVTLAEGENEISVTVTAEDGTTTKTYTVTVTRVGLPVVSIAAVEERVTGPIGAVRATRTGPTAEPLEVQVHTANSRAPGVQTLTFRFLSGQSSVTGRVQIGDNKLVEDDITVTWTLQEGAGYTVSAEHASASVVVEESDTPEFAVSVEPAEITEGESATVTVTTSNGVRFAEDQTIGLSVSGTASATDYTGVPATLTLAARASSVTATLVATEDQAEEEAETVTVTASHGGSAIGSATVTINSVSHDATLASLSLSGVDIGTFSAAVTSYQASVAASVTATTVTATASHSEATVSIDPGPEVNLALGANAIAVTVTAEDGTTTRTYTVTVTRAGIPEVSIAAVSSPVTEGAAAAFEVRLAEAALEALTVAVSVTESGSMLSGVVPVSVALSKGDTSATLSAPTAGDAVVEADSTVTAAVTAGTGYTVGTASSAAVTVEDDDAATFTVTATPSAIDEGESATLTVAISNGVTFAEDQTISLATSGTASASDYTGVPPTLALVAGASSVTATLAATEDQAEEEAETVTVTASHGGSAIGSATVTITSVSHDATLSALSLSGVDIGTFSNAVTSYQASVANSVTATTVTATASHSEATVSIAPGPEVSLAEGANRITVTVTAESGTRKTYTVTVTRAVLPVVSVAAVKERVPGPIGAVRATRTGPTAEPLEVQVHMTNSRAPSVQTLTFRFLSGQSSMTRRTQVGDNKLVEDDITVTWTLQEGAGYTVSAEHASASVVVEESDTPEFAVSVEPAEITEGESATVTVTTSNGVRFAEDQTIALSVSGTASATDYTGVPATLTLAARASSVTATLAAAADQAEEAAETVTVTASHGGSAIGSATVTINSVSHDATLAALSLSGVDIGTFSDAVTSYQASVANSVTATTVTATASHSVATVSIAPGPEVSLAEGANRITVTVTAESGTRKTYTVTVTRAVLPVVSVAAVKERVPGPIGAVRATRTGPTAEPLEVQVHMTNSRAPSVQTLTFRFLSGQSSVTRRVQAGDNKLVEDDITVTWTLQQGAGYTVSAEHASASVVVEESDTPEFAVTVEPAEITEGESATVTVATSNGVRFAEDQTIALSVSGTASATDYTGVPATLTLSAYGTSTAATLTAVADQEEEASETVTITASHGGAEIGSATVTVAASVEVAPSGAGFPLAPENSRPSGIWSDGETVWVADLADARLYAYRREDGERQPDNDIATEPSPMGLWSDSETLWVAQHGGGLKAYRLADGARLVGLDLALEADAAPAGVWSDGDTAWVSEWLGDTVHAYSLDDGQRAAERDIKLEGGNLLPMGLWSDGETLWVADWRERMYAYRLSDGERMPELDLRAGSKDEDPSGLWSGGETLLSTSWQSRDVQAYSMPEAPPRSMDASQLKGLAGQVGSVSPIADPALLGAIKAALGKANGEPVSATELAGLESLKARNADISDLSGLMGATSLKELDLGFNPVADLQVLALLPTLESLNLDGTTPDLQPLASLVGLKRLSLRNTGIDDLQPLASLVGLTELDVGDNRIADLSPLAGLSALTALMADRNRIADLWPLAALADLETLELGANFVRDLQPLAGLTQLRSLHLEGNGLTDLSPLAGLAALRDLGLAGNAVESVGAMADLDGLRRLDLRGNAVGDLRPLSSLPSLVWVHVGGSQITDLAPLDNRSGLTVAGREDRDSPSVTGGDDARTGRR